MPRCCMARCAAPPAGGAHPTFFGQDKAFAEKVQCPLVLLPAQGDPMELVKEVLDTRWAGWAGLGWLGWLGWQVLGGCCW